MSLVKDTREINSLYGDPEWEIAVGMHGVMRIEVSPEYEQAAARGWLHRFIARILVARRSTFFRQSKPARRRLYNSRRTAAAIVTVSVSMSLVMLLSHSVKR